MTRALVVLAVVALCAAGCGSGGAKPPVAASWLTHAQQQGLIDRLTRVRAAVAAPDRALAEQRLRGFVREVGRLQRSRALAVATADALRVAAGRTLARLELEVPPAPVQAPVTQPAPPAGTKKHADKNPKGPGKHGKGHGKGEGD
jgi:hypothetical protein